MFKSIFFTIIFSLIIPFQHFLYTAHTLLHEKKWTNYLIDKEVNDPEIINDLIDQFPYSQYKIYFLGKDKFFIDQINDSIKNGIRQGIPHETYISELLRKFTPKNGSVIDAGAHIGTHTLFLANQVGPNGKVYAFEPQPKIFNELFHNIILNKVKNVRLYYCALGDYSGEIELSPLTMGNEGGTPISGGTGTFTKLITLDSLNLSQVDLMKVDIEGMEQAFLSGAAKTIIRCRPVIIIELMGGYDFYTAPEPVREQILASIKQIEAFGYVVKKIRTHDYLAMPIEHASKL